MVIQLCSTGHYGSILCCKDISNEKKKSKSMSITLNGPHSNQNADSLKTLTRQLCPFKLSCSHKYVAEWVKKCMVEYEWVKEWVSVTSFKFWFHIKYYPAYFPCSGVNYLPWVPGRIGFQHIVTDGTDKAANCLISHMGWWQNLGQLNQQTAK